MSQMATALGGQSSNKHVISGNQSILHYRRHREVPFEITRNKKLRGNEETSVKGHVTLELGCKSLAMWLTNGWNRQPEKVGSLRDFKGGPSVFKKDCANCMTGEVTESIASW